jgi:hypothetical protein
MRLFEFGDQPWLPKVLRDGERAYLTFCYRQIPLARAWAERMLSVVDPHKRAGILDLCSGEGGPVEELVKEFNARGYDVSVTLTDLYPGGRSAAGPHMTWHPGAVDARSVPPQLTGIRTLFNAFHHFDRKSGRAILADSFRRRIPICVFDAGSGTPIGCASMFLVPFNVLAVMPFVRPFRWEYALFTYLIPVLPIMVFWDGFVSMLRIYSTDQLNEFVRDLVAPDYVWEVGALQLPRIPGKLPYLIGRPLKGAG